MPIKLIVIPLVMLAATTAIWNLWLEKRFWRIVGRRVDRSKKPVFIDPEKG